MRDIRCTAALLLIASLPFLPTACAPSPDSEATGSPQGDTPGGHPAAGLADPLAADGAGMPNLFATDDGRVLMSWLEPVGEAGEAASTRRGRHALRFSTFEGDTWSPARTIAEGDDFFVNWADFPVIIETDGTLVAHWLRRNGGRGTAYDIHITRSEDGGESWTESIVPHRDGTPTEHGFVSMVPEPDGGFTAVWLDGRAFADDAAEDEMSLRGARFAADGSQGDVELLDPRICECCQTSAAYVGDNLVAVYRDRDHDEVREMYAVTRTPDGWSEPIRVSHDNWQIPGCPVNGPAIAAGPNGGAVAWYSLTGGKPEVKVAFTPDGLGFGPPILLDRGPDEGYPAPEGRVSIVWVDDSRVAVSWLVLDGSGADVVVQTVDLDGNLGPRHTVAETSSSRASGFPRIARSGERLLIAWTLPDASPSLRTTLLPLPIH